jgi:hypothetical protein
MASVSCRRVIALIAVVGLLGLASAQPPPGAAAPGASNAAGTTSPTNTGPPLYGAARPTTGPDPSPHVKRPTDCPPGYIAPRESLGFPHLVVCVVKPLNLVALNTVSGPGPAPAGTLSSMPPILERSTVNQCVGRPAGSYACGRGGTECCRANQDNMCFAGAYACYPHGSGTGAKTACCMSK